MLLGWCVCFVFVFSFLERARVFIWTFPMWSVVDSASKWADYQVRHILQSHTHTHKMVKNKTKKNRISYRNIRWSSPPPMHPAPSRRCCKSGRLLTVHWLLVADQSAGGGLGFPRGGACRLQGPTECRDNAEDSHSPPPTAPVFPSYFSFEPKKPGLYSSLLAPGTKHSISDRAAGTTSHPALSPTSSV